MGHSKFFPRIYSLAQFEIVKIFSRIFQTVFPFWQQPSWLFSFCESDEILVTFQIIHLLCESACCGDQKICWLRGKKVLCWGGIVGCRGSGEEVALRRGMEIHRLFWIFYKRDRGDECFILAPREKFPGLVQWQQVDQLSSPLSVIYHFPVSFSKCIFTLKSKSVTFSLWMWGVSPAMEKPSEAGGPQCFFFFF